MSGEPLAGRRSLLEGVGVPVVPQSPDIAATWALVHTQGMEGLVVKRADSTWVPRRSRHWVKIRNLHTVSALVTALEPGEGVRAGTFGALRLALLNATDGTLVSIGKVGAGFSVQALADVAAAHAGATSAGEQLVVEVEYLEVSPSGQLRHPTFRGIRGDLTSAEATLDQLPAPRAH